MKTVKAYIGAENIQKILQFLEIDSTDKVELRDIHIPKAKFIKFDFENVYYEETEDKKENELMKLN